MSRGLNQIVRRAVNPPDPLTPLIDEYLLARPYEPPPLPEKKGAYSAGGRFTPSSSGGCFRQSAFRFMRVKGQSRTTPEQELIFGVGNWLHRMWQSYFDDMQRVLGPERFKFIGYEVWCTVPKFYLAGNLDVWAEISGVPVIIDVKTANDRMYGNIIMRGTPPEDHVDQLVRYMRATGVPWGMLLYFDKDNQDYKIFEVRYKLELWTPTVRWLRTAIDFLLEEEVPPMHRECKVGTWMQKNCPYSYLCYKSPDIDLERLLYEGQPAIDKLWEEACASISRAE